MFHNRTFHVLLVSLISTFFVGCSDGFQAVSEVDSIALDSNLLDARSMGGSDSFTIEAEHAKVKTKGGPVEGGWLLWTNGVVADQVQIRNAGEYEITVIARGRPAGGIWPTMQVLVDDEAVGSLISVNNIAYSEYKVTTNLNVGAHTIGAAFTNDAKVGSENRDLYLDKFIITQVAAVTPTTGLKSGPQFVNENIGLMKGRVVVEFDLLPETNNVNGLTSLSMGQVLSYGDAAAIVRLNSEGFIDVRDGSVYSYKNKVNYTAGTPVHIRMLVDIPNKKYDVFAGNAPNEIEILSGASFRTEQMGVTGLDTLSIQADPGIHSLLNFSVKDAQDLTISTGLASGNSFQNEFIGQIPNIASVQFDLQPSAANINAVTALAFGNVSGYEHTAVAVRFSPTGIIDVRDGDNYTALTPILYTGGQVYRVKMLINVSQKKYDVFVTLPTGGQVTLATGAKFRTEQSGVSKLDTLATKAESGSHKVFNLKVEASTVETPTEETPSQETPSVSRGLASENSFQNEYIGQLPNISLVEFDLQPSGSNLNAITALALGNVTAYSDAAAIVRLSPDGIIDVRDGNDYTALTSIAYAGGQTYRVKMLVNIIKKRYDVSVVLPSGTEKKLAIGASFRTEQAGVAGLNTLATRAETGSHKVTNFKVTKIELSPSVSNGLVSNNSFQNELIGQLPDYSVVEFDVRPSAANMNGIVGLSQGNAASYSDVAAAVRFNPDGAIDIRNGGAYSALTRFTYVAGNTYRIKMVINIPQKKYDVSVGAPSGGSQTQLATGASFRTEQAGVAGLNTMTTRAEVGSHQIFNLKVTRLASAPANPSPSQPSPSEPAPSVPQPDPALPPGKTPPTPDVVIRLSSATVSALSAAIDQAPAGKVTEIILPASATMKVTTNLSKDITGKTIVINQNGALIDFDASVGFGFRGSHGTTYTVNSLSVNSAGKTVANMASFSGWNKGDIVKIFSLNDELPGSRLNSDLSNGRRMGELMQIESINGNTVTFTEQLRCQSCYKSGLRAAKLNQATLWWIKPNMVGELTYTMSHISVTSTINSRIIAPQHRKNGRQFISLTNNWKPYVWEPVLAEGRADTKPTDANNGYWTYGVLAMNNKHALVEGSGKVINCTSLRHCVDSSGISPKAGDPTQYGADIYTTAMNLRADKMLSSSFATHAESWNFTYKNIVSTNSQAWCVSFRGRNHVLDGMQCSGPYGVQLGVKNDGLLGNVAIKNVVLNNTIWTATVETSVLVPGAVLTLTDSSCSKPVHSAIKRTNSPGC